VIAGRKSQPAEQVNFAPSAPAVAKVQPTTEPVAEQQPVSNEMAPFSDTLARKTNEYARTLEPAARRHTAVTHQPSPVRWTEAGHPAREAANREAVLPLTPAAGAVGAEGAAPVGAVASVWPADSAHLAAVTQSANSNALNDVPAIVPESSDFPSKPATSADTLEQRLTRAVHDNPRDVGAQLDYQLYEMLKDDASPQLASVSMLPTEDRELVSALVDGVSNFRNSIRQDNNTLVSKKIRPILDMADRLRDEAELSIPTVALCTRVDGFGRYQPIDPPRFPAMQVNPVIVYCEVANFASRPTDSQMWETKLRQEVTLYTETGLPVWHDKSRDVVDECRDRRHDFFLYDMVKLPGNLSVGRYILKITIEDQTVKRVREATVPIEMVAQE
jgi:hypothetical protein